MNAANYLKNWATVLRADPKNLYRAAKFATAATKYLIEITDDERIAA